MILLNIPVIQKSFEMNESHTPLFHLPAIAAAVASKGAASNRHAHVLRAKALVNS
jgi:hypothetical protein